VLDLGCGTGTLALLLAADGREVIGVDPAGASLDVARGKDTAGRVRWYHGDATSLPPLAVDLVTMTGNVAQVFLDDVSWSATLRGIHDALVPGGHLCFETRRTAARAWEEWAAPSEPERLDVPGLGVVEQEFALTEVALPCVSFRYTYRLPDGATIESRSTLRFRDLDEITRSLDDAGFEVVAVRDAADRPGHEHVVLARRPI
jgi:SAM-dependent methyltransferase